MREIKFRGKSVFDDSWVYGFLIEDVIMSNCDTDEGCFFPGEFCSVIPKTIGQYTGLKDKNGKETYEGDICKDSTGDIVQIAWSENHQWGCKIIKGCTLNQGLIFPLWQWDRCKENGYRELEVIGNIYKNPELLEAAK